MFKSNIERLKANIIEYDRAVKVALNQKPGRPIKPRSVKSIRSDINQPYFSCKKCDDAFDNYGKLKKHKVTVHTFSNSMNSVGNNSLLSIKHSTRNNSLSEEMLLCEDITLFNLGESNSAKPSLEESTEHIENIEPKYTCELCKQTFGSETDLQKHILSHTQNFKCVQCSYEVTNEYDLSIHVAKQHPPCMRCDNCPFEASSQQELETHASREHPPCIKCDNCQFTALSQQELLTHANQEHKVKKRRPWKMNNALYMHH